jgi:hypothetical protein
METIIVHTPKKLLTKYFYQENRLCFQILLSSNNEKAILVGEFSNYSEYRKSFNALLNEIESGNIVDLNTYMAQRPLSRVA